MCSNQKLRNFSKIGFKVGLILGIRITKKQLIIKSESSSPKVYQTLEEKINRINDVDAD